MLRGAQRGGHKLLMIYLIPVVVAENVIDVVFDAPKLAVPVGTVCGVQLVLEFQSLDPGLVPQVAPWA
jgi:hypothetical protein